MRKNEIPHLPAHALLVALLVLLGSADSYAKELNYARMRFGLGFYGGAQSSGDSNMAAATPTTIPKYAYEYGGELIIPVDDVFIRPLYSVQNLGTSSGKGTDSTGNYTQSAGGQVRYFGGKLSVPIVVNDRATRFIYVGFGIGKASLSATLSRQYTSGSSNAYLQNVSGGGVYWDAHAGFSQMLVQNWGCAIELGFRHYNIEEITSSSKSDLAGATIMGSNTVYSTNSTRAYYNVADPYLIGSLHLMF